MQKVVLSLVVMLFVVSCQAPKTNPGDAPKVNKEEMAAKVVAQFRHAWEGYKKYAWGNDALNPLTKAYHNWYKESLLMTPVDAYSTMCTMGLEKEKAEAKELIFSKLAFDKDMYVQHFEISIRLLAGLLSAYEMDGDKRFLQLAEDLAKRMLPVWNSPTGLPYRYVNLKTGKVRDSISNPAEMGTYILEYAKLSQLTNNPVYKEKAEKAMTFLTSKRSKLNMTGSSMNILTGQWTDPLYHIGGGIDSYLEYLLKYYYLTGEKSYLETWKIFKPSLDKYVAHETNNGLWYSVVNMNTGERVSKTYGALHAFYSGLLCLDGDTAQARKLQESNFKLWTHYGIEPEMVEYETMKIPDWARYYMLRPENIEGAFYLYRFTKDERFLHMGVEYYNSLEKYCRTDAGYAHLKDVVTKEKHDAMESFFLAETLNYLYLLFAPESKFDFNTHVLNTEAHPLRKMN